MGKVLLAIDGTAGSISALSVYKTMAWEPESVILVHVRRSEGKFVLIDTLCGPERESLRNSTQDTEHQEALDRKAEKIMGFCRQEIETGGPVVVKALVREGVPSEEILKAAREEKVDLIIMGRSGKSGLQRLAAGCVTKEVERVATVPVLVAKTGGREKSITYRWRGAYAAR
jgi:nucleotide-binding universal stress UspA family protein